MKLFKLVYHTQGDILGAEFFTLWVQCETADEAIDIWRDWMGDSYTLCMRSPRKVNKVPKGTERWQVLYEGLNEPPMPPEYKF